MIRRLAAAALCVLQVLLFLGGCADAPRGLTVLDAQEQVLTAVEDARGLYADDRGAYLDIVLSEATQVLAQVRGCTLEEAQAHLFAGCRVYTAFDTRAFRAVQQGVKDWRERLRLGCAVTDLQGWLVAAYSVDPSQNMAVRPAPPCSAFKPLSVYTPALEAGVINWMTETEDSPYKELTLKDGGEASWPENDSGSYTYENIPLSQAVQSSVNTVAVKCLVKLGPEQSLRFLHDALGVPVERETQILDALGPDEILGNLALGYLQAGVSPVDMAGYYQIFATGGRYTQPKTVRKICDARGRVLYTRESQSQQAVSTATAELMNALLQEVVTPAGTGSAAACREIDVAGKTGTSEGFADNWFVGVTPAFSCAVYHTGAQSNQAAGIFRSVAEGLHAGMPESQRRFAPYTQLREAVFCCESGLEATGRCPVIEAGYWPGDQTLIKCDVH